MTTPQLLRSRWSSRAIVRAGLALGVLFACTEGALEPVRVASVVISGGGESLRLGQQAQLAAVTKSVEGFTLPTTGVTWTSSDASVATVSPTGQVTALKRGTATISASAGGVSGTATAVVIGVQAVSIPQDTLAVVVQAQGTVTATVTADPGVSVPASWVARDTTVAQVTGSGQITARKLGTTWVVASAEVAADSVRVVVTPVPVTPPASGAAGPVTTSVLGGAVSLTIPPGATTAPALTVAPAPVAPTDDRIPAGLTYVFGPAGSQFASPITLSVAYDPAQIPAAKRPLLRLHLVNGTTVTEVAGSAVDLANNRVTAPVSHFSTYAILVPADPSQLAVTAGAGQATFVEYEVPTAPSVTVKDAQGRPVARAKVSFDITAGGGRFRNGATQSSDTATTDANGVATLGAKWRLGSSAGANTLTIKVFTAAGAQATTTTITATAQANPVARVVVTPASASLAVGATQQLSATLYDARDTVLTGRTVTWTSTDTSRATVSSTGLVTAVSPGLASISVSAEGKSTAVSVTIRVPTVTEILVSPSSVRLHPGQTVVLAVSARDSVGEEVPNAPVSLASSNAAVVQVLDAGVVSAVSIGTASIVVQSGNASRTIEVIVASPVLVDIDAGTVDGCGISQFGYAMCWGATATGGEPPRRFADELVVATDLPEPCVQLLGAACQASRVGVGDAHACAINVDGRAYCWRFGGANVSKGQLGTGSSLADGFVAGSLSFVSISAGGGTTCGLDADGRAYCWGANSIGQLGDSSTVNRLTPVPVKTSVRFVQLSVGITHVCGVSVSRLLYCWGDNSSGQLAVGDNIERFVPALTTPQRFYVNVSAGNKMSCAVDESSRAYCAGSALANALGTLAPGGSRNLLDYAVSASSSHSSVASAARETYNCAVSVVGVGSCWGENYSGQFGNGVVDPGQGYIGVVAISEPIRKIVAGYATNYAVTSSGTLYGWGKNDLGQLGISVRFEHTPTPRKILP